MLRTADVPNFILFGLFSCQLKDFAQRKYMAHSGKNAQLFGVQRPAITKHLKNIFESSELEEEVVSSILEHTTPHGAIEGKLQTQPVKYYNLDVIISGCLVKSY